LVYIRQRLVADPDAPDQTALIQGLSNDTGLLEQSVSQMQEAYATGNQADAKMNAESVINLIEGKQSPVYKDWNGDGQVSDPGTGYGFLQNGNNLGHVQVIFSNADYVANSAGASENMIDRSSEVKTCTENLAQWLPQLKEQAQKIVNAASITDMEKPIQEAIALAKNIHNGTDLNGNLKIELLTGECGVVDLYKSAYAMADMPLLPVNTLGTGTVVPGTPSPVGTVINVTPTKGPGGGGGGAATQPAATKVPPGQQRTKEPKPTKPGGGGGGGGINGHP